MARDLESLLESELLTVPDDFTDRVMRSVAASEREAPRRRWREYAQWLAVACGAALGALELGSFVLSVWLATTAS